MFASESANTANTHDEERTVKVEQAEVTGETHEVGADQMFFSATDERGIIDHSNKVFVELSRYGRDELIGAPHNVIRHPAMPRGVFHAMWATIKAGQPFAAYVRNLASDGSEYDVFATVTPLEDGGYLSVRIRPGCEGLFGAALSIYEKAAAFEEKLESDGLTRRQVASEGAAKILELLDEAGMPSYEDFQNIALPAEVAKRESVADEFPERPEASGALAQMLSDAKGIAKELDVWMNRQDDLADLSAALRSTRDGLRKEVDDDALSAALGQSESTTEKLAQLLETWGQMKDLVREPTDQLVDALARLDKISAQTRFRVALARLHTTMMAKFTAELIDGGADADVSADAIAMLGGALRKGLSEMEEMAAAHADLASQTADFIVETSNLLAIPRQVLMLWNEGQDSDSEGASDGPDTLADAVSRHIDAVGESLEELDGLARRCRDFDTAIDSSTLKTLLDDAEQRLFALA